jgi:apolipoprotein N-acyltransferase
MTLYARLGDWFPLLLGALLIILVVVRVFVYYLKKE